MLLGNIIKDGFLGIVLTLDSIIYSLISSAYKIFMALAGARLLSSDAYNAIANKVYIVIGVVMLFVLAYAMLKAIIDPDQASKGDLGGPKLLKNVIIAVVGLAIAPVAFNLLYQVQGLIMENNVLGKIFFRSDNQTYDYPNINIGNGEESVTVTLDEDANYYNNMIQTVGGAHVATTIWQAFFYPVEEGAESQIKADTSVLHATSVGLGLACAAGIAGAVVGGLASVFTLGTSLLIAGAGVAACVGAASSEKNADKIDSLMDGNEFTLKEAYIYSASEGDFWIYQGFIEPLSDDEIHYSWFLSTIVGAFVAYAFITFSIDMGMRAAKLAYYQIIAPIPIILQILPKFKDSFNKYVKSVVSTFIEVFVRITVVYVVVYIMCHLTDMFSTTAMWAGLNLPERMFAIALLMLGLVLFAKQAPKMISETFGIQSGSIDMGIRKKLAEGGAFTAGAFLGGGLTTGIRSLTQAGANIKKNWKEKTTAEGFQDKSFGGRARTYASVIGGGVARGAASTIAGAASGAVLSGYAGRKAANVKDMTTAAREGIGKATLKSKQREEYREAHPPLKFKDLNDALKTNLEDKKGVQKWTAGVSTVVGATGVAGGHLKDMARSVAGWAGLNNLEAIDGAIKKANDLKAAKKDMKTKAESLITSKAASSKRGALGVDKSITFDFSLEDNKKFSMFQGKDFEKFDVEVYRRITDGLEQAKQKNGFHDGISSADWEAFRGKYLSDFTDEVQNVVLQSETNYQTQMKDDTKTNAWLTEVRAAANTFKNALAKNVGEEWVIKANAQEADVTKPHEYATVDQQLTAAYITGNLKVNKESALSKLDDQIDISVGKLNETRSKLKEKQPEAKKNDGK